LLELDGSDCKHSAAVATPENAGLGLLTTAVVNRQT